MIGVQVQNFKSEARHSHLPHLTTIFKQSQVRIKAKSPVARVTRNLGQQSNFNKAIDNAIRTSGL
jgi:hypothetical protein